MTISEHVDRAHDRIVAQIINEEVLVPYISRAEAAGVDMGVYPVVIGGTNMIHADCLSEQARTLFHHFTNNDIDIKFIIANRNLPHPWQYDTCVTLANYSQMSLISDLLNDDRISEIIDVHTIHAVPGLKCTMLDVFEGTKTHNDEARKTFKTVIRIVYEMEDGTSLRRDLFDTAIYSSQNHPMLGSMCLFQLDAAYPVPFCTHKGIPFATRQWMYLETIRTLLVHGEKYHSALEERQCYSAVEVNKTLKCFMKCLLRFAIVAAEKIVMEELSDQLNVLHPLFEKVYDILDETECAPRTFNAPCVQKDHMQMFRKLVRATVKRVGLDDLEDMLVDANVIMSL